MSGRRVLVTGGAGFIGSHVCDAYLRQGWKVTALDDLSSGKRENVPTEAEFVELDVRSPRLRELFQTHRFDLVNHHAAQMDVRVSVERPRHDASINIDGLLNLLECCVEYETGRVVFISSGGVVYGEAGSVPAVRTTRKLPESPYGVSKLASEYYLFAFRRLHGLPYVALRYSNVFGPRQNPHGEAGVVAIFSRRLLEGLPLTVFGDGEQTRDYVYVQDVAAANLVASEMALPDPQELDEVAFNVGTGRETTVNELANTLVEISGTGAEIQFAPARPGELQRSALDVSEWSELGWAPRYSLRKGLQQTYDWISREVA